MTERDAFLRQAASDYRVFRLLFELEPSAFPVCHALHYLQMATEKLAKAAMLAVDQPADKLTHVAFSQRPYILARSIFGRRLGWRRDGAYRHFLKKARPLFREIDELNPSVGTAGSANAAWEQPNVEYPWRARNVEGQMAWHAPAEEHWPLIERLRGGEGIRVIQFIDLLLERFDGVFR